MAELDPDDAEQALELLRKKRYNELSDPDAAAVPPRAGRAGLRWDAVRRPWTGGGRNWRRKTIS